MGFLSPWFLAGVLAVGLPIWLHLLRQFKRTPRQFSSLMFFERRLQNATKRLRLRHLVLLAMRLAVLVLLALAFADPFIYRTAIAGNRSDLTVIAIDHSFSMRTRGRMEAAKSEAHRVLNSVPGGHRVEVLAFDSRVDALTQPEADKSAAATAIDSIQPADTASSYGELSRALRIMDQSTGMRLSAHVVTDVQQSSMPSAFADLQVGPHTSETIHAVGKPVANWAVTNVSAPARIFGSGNTKISATLTSWNTDSAVKNISLLLDGRVIASKQTTVTPCGATALEFDNVAIPFGVHRGEVRLDSHDDLPGDDRFPFSIERSDPRKVLFLYSSGRGFKAFYYQSALSAATTVGLTVEPSPIEQVADQQLSRFAFAVLNDPAELDDKTSSQLSTYVSKGGALFIALGPATETAGRIPLTGNEVVPGETTEQAGHIDNQSPELANFGQFENVQFLRPAHVSVGENDRVLARFGDGSPLLFERKLGEGRVLVFASTLDNSSSDFPLHTSFLPFVAQTAAYLSGAADTPSSVVVGTPIALRQSREQTTAADVVGPEGHHELPLHEATRAMTYDIPRDGFYDVQRANGQRLLVAVHADRRESDLTPVSAETLALWRNIGINPNTVAGTVVDRTTVSWSLWRYVLLLLLIAAIIESLFASRYLRQER